MRHIPATGNEQQIIAIFICLFCREKLKKNIISGIVRIRMKATSLANQLEKRNPGKDIFANAITKIIAATAIFFSCFVFMIESEKLFEKIPMSPTATNNIA